MIAALAGDGNHHDPRAPRPAEETLVGYALALGARSVRGWSAAEQELRRNATTAPEAVVEMLRSQIESGEDPLGTLFCSLRSPPERRKTGATFTPSAIVSLMLDRVEKFGTPIRVVDPGTGSGRFAVKAGMRFPRAKIVAVESDPLSALIARANLAASGLAARSQVVVDNYCTVQLEPAGGRTLYIGNPPYVRHHLLDRAAKRWLIRSAARCGLSASQLAGLHVHFFLATVLKASPGDFGALITAAEWLDVNYGSIVRELFLGDLGGRGIVLIDPRAMPFPDAATTAAITLFEIGTRPTSVLLSRAETLEDIGNESSTREIRRERLESECRWTRLTRAAKRGPSGYVELGEICRVHRGQVTGANRVWIAGEHSAGLPASVLFPSVTRAKELFHAGGVLSDASSLKRVIDLPPDLDAFDRSERKRIDQFLRRAEALGADRGYIATNRKAWWSVGLRQPAPVLATYMARRPPAFVRNTALARHLNIAHGLYPREALADVALMNLVEYLSGAVNLTEGRTYAGGLTKFEPREMERLLVPELDVLAQVRS
jgi:adenine-specific DNA-methyltransferase